MWGARRPRSRPTATMSGWQAAGRGSSSGSTSAPTATPRKWLSAAAPSRWSSPTAQGLGERAEPTADPSGGTAVLSSPLFTLDPGVASGTGPVQYATCAMLLNYPDEPSSAGLRLVPDAARSLPPGSGNGRTYTFMIRPGMRFSPPSNQPVTAQTFKHAIERTLNPHLGDGASFGQTLLRDVVGARAYLFCAVPTDTPNSPVAGALPSAVPTTSPT